MDYQLKREMESVVTENGHYVMLGLEVKNEAIVESTKGQRILERVGQFMIDHVIGKKINLWWVVMNVPAIANMVRDIIDILKS